MNNRLSVDPAAVAVKGVVMSFGGDAMVADAIGSIAAACVSNKRVRVIDVARVYRHSVRWVWLRIRENKINYGSIRGRAGSVVDLCEFVDAVGLPRASKSHETLPGEIAINPGA